MNRSDFTSYTDWFLLFSLVMMIDRNVFQAISSNFDKYFHSQVLLDQENGLLFTVSLCKEATVLISSYKINVIKIPQINDMVCIVVKYITKSEDYIGRIVKTYQN